MSYHKHSSHTKRKRNRLIRSKTYLAGGCFWGIEEKLHKLPGIVSTRVGYMGGFHKYPSYEDVCSGKTGHAETVEVVFNKRILKFQKLLDHFFLIHDPYEVHKKDSQYRSIVFVTNKQQERCFLRYLSQYPEIKTELRFQEIFYPAEDYHQKYSFQLRCNSFNTEDVDVFRRICKGNKTKAEKKGSGKYLYNKKKGTYQCACCGTNLYYSTSKYDSNTGWPAFTSEILKSNLLYNPKTAELRCAVCGLHLGHRMFDGPTLSKQHDCINSACLHFNASRVARKKTHKKPRIFTHKPKHLTQLGLQWAKAAAEDMKKRQIINQ